MNELLVYEHGADLRRTADAARLSLAVSLAVSRAASRADRARPAARQRAAGWLRAALHRPALPVGCEA